MPIDLTTVPDDQNAGSHQRRRRRRHNQRRNTLWAIVGGILALTLFGGGFYLLHFTRIGSTPTFTNGVGNSTRMEPSTVPDEHTVESARGPVTVVPAAAITSGELPPETARARLYAFRRVISSDGRADLELSYEFLPLARPPREYVIGIRVGKNIARVKFQKNSAPQDTIRFGEVLRRLGNEGSIDVWVETIAPAEQRISNIMTIQ